MTWSSANPAVLSSDGTVVRPGFGSDNVSVDITGTFEREGVQFSKTYAVNILALSELEIQNEIADVISRLPFVGQTVSERVNFPSSSEGIILTYESLNPNKITNEGVVFKTVRVQLQSQFQSPERKMA